MKKRSNNNRTARFDSQKNKAPRFGSKRYVEPKPRLSHQDFLMQRWEDSLSDEDYAFYVSDQCPARQKFCIEARAAKKAAAKLPPPPPPIFTTKRSRIIKKRSPEPDPNSKEGKWPAQQRLDDAAHEKFQRQLLHIEAKMRKLLAIQALVEPDTYDRWKKSIRPWKEQE